MSTDTKPVSGSCLCGEVTLSVLEFDRHVLACHCQQCRKQTGSFVHAAGVQDVNLRVAGEQHIQWYAASESAKRGFCRHCGSLLFWKSNGSASTSVMTGCLESPSGLEIIGHIFVADKGDYYTINDGVDQFEQSGGQM